MGEPDIAPGEKVIEETRPVPLSETPLFGILAVAIMWTGAKLVLRAWYGKTSLAHAAIEIAMVLILLYLFRDYKKNYYEKSRYTLTDKRMILQGKIREEGLSSLLKPGAKEENAVSIPYSTVAAIKIKKSSYLPILQITQNLAGHEAGKDVHREYAMIAIPKPEETMKKILGFAPWAAASGQGPSKAIKK